MKLFEKLNSLDVKSISLLIGVLQGLLLLLMYELRSFDLYTSIYSALLITIIMVPMTIVLTLECDVVDSEFYWKTIGCFSALTFLLAFYFGLKQNENIFFEEYRWIQFNTPSFFFTFLIAWFIFLLFFQSTLQEKKLVSSYQAQFNNSWNNFLTVILSHFFLLLWWGVLFLWAMLFDRIGVGLFLTLFSKSWFYIPTTTIALMTFIHLLKSRVDAVETIRRILQSLFQSILPLTLCMTVMFAVIILFLGVDTLWGSHSRLGTSTLLLATSFCLFFFNAVYQSGEEAPYNSRLDSIIRYSLCILIIFLGLSLYGLGSRISQYGWTVNIAHGVIVTIVLSGYVIAYSISNFLHASTWKFYFRNTNSLGAIAIAMICVLLNTPLLNVEKITVNHHMQRYTSGVIDSSEIDVYYLARKSGSYGVSVLEMLKENPQYADKAILQSNIEKAQASYDHSDYKKHISQHVSDDASKRSLRIVPLNAEIPSLIMTYLSDRLKSEGCFKKKLCSLIVQDLNQDNTPEYTFIDASPSFGTKAFMLSIYYDEKSKSSKVRQFRVNFSANVSGLCCLHDKLDGGVKIGAKDPTWQDLVIGKQRFMIDSISGR